MRFKIDENLSIEFADLLAQAGHDAVTVVDQQLQGQDDPVVINACLREERALVTLDLDFADMRAYPPLRYPGLVVLRLRQQDIQGVIPALKQEPVGGRLWIVEEARIRIRGED